MIVAYRSPNIQARTRSGLVKSVQCLSSRYTCFVHPVLPLCARNYAYHTLRQKTSRPTAVSSSPARLYGTNPGDQLSLRTYVHTTLRINSTLFSFLVLLCHIPTSYNFSAQGTVGTRVVYTNPVYSVGVSNPKKQRFLFFLFFAGAGMATKRD